MFRVSVIIPVYNAEKFVEQAVNSALALEETGEVILVEDRSPDNVLQICIRLERENSLVKLYRHPNGENRGAGASRNLGIQKASCEYISFLDADDYYLANRFVMEKQVFLKNNEADFTYSASQMLDDYVNKINTMRTLRGGYSKRQLFYELLEGRNGDFDTNSITVKRSCFSMIAPFKADLRLHQDTELWYRMAYHLNGFPACTDKPVAVVRRHENNRIVTLTFQSRLQMWRTIKDEFDPLPLTWKERILLNLHYDYYSKGIKGSKLFNRIRKIKIILVTKLFYIYRKMIKA